MRGQSLRSCAAGPNCREGNTLRMAACCVGVSGRKSRARRMCQLRRVTFVDFALRVGVFATRCSVFHRYPKGKPHEARFDRRLLIFSRKRGSRCGLSDQSGVVAGMCHTRGTTRRGLWRASVRRGGLVTAVTGGRYWLVRRMSAARSRAPRSPARHRKAARRRGC